MQAVTCSDLQTTVPLSLFVSRQQSQQRGDERTANQLCGLSVHNSPAETSALYASLVFVLITVCSVSSLVVAHE